MKPLLSLWRGDVIQPRRTTATSHAREIAEAVAAEYGLTLADLRKVSHARAIAWPRQHVMHALYTTGRFSLPTIGKFLGGMNHTSVRHGVKRHAERMAAA